MKIALILFGVFVFGQTVMAANCVDPNSITKVTNRKVGVFEYVDFFIKAPFSGTVLVKAASSATFIQDGSGNPIHVGGNKWTDVTFRQMDWLCSSLINFSLPKPVLKDIKLIGSFEGQIEYAIGRHNGHYFGQSLSTVGGQRRLTLKFKP